MKIALVIDTFDELNGVARTYHRFVEFCRKKNISLTIFTPGVARSDKTDGSVRIQRFRATRPLPYYRELPPFDLAIFSLGFREAFNPTEFDIVHLATPGSLGIAARLITKKKVPTIGVYHTLLDIYAEYLVRSKRPFTVSAMSAPLARVASRYALNWFYRGCDMVLAPSNTIKLQLAILKRPLELFPRGVDTDAFHPRYNDPSLSSGTPAALYVGRLSPEKNLGLLVDLWKDRTDCDLWIVGDGSQHNYLKKHLPRAHFFGALTGHDLSRVYASADFFIFPSTTDTFGNVVLEAMASGLPAIVTNVGGPQELIENGITGFTTEPTVQAFSQKINQLATNKKMCRDLGITARAKVEARDWDSAFNRLISEYIRLCNTRSNRASL